MADLPEDLKDRYGLHALQTEAIQARIIKRFTKGVLPAVKPKVILLCGQPGAGKTGIQHAAEKELSFNAVVCNSDNARGFHLKAGEINKRHETDYPAVTAPFAHGWTLALQQYCRRNKLNYLLETTMQYGKGVNETIAAIKKHGYTVDIKLMAVNNFLSLLGAYERLEDMRRREGQGRVVSKTEHDLRYHALPGALREIQEAKLYDNFSIYGRYICLPHPQSDELKLIATNPADPVKEYLKERDRPWTDLEKQVFNDRVRMVEYLMQSRNAPVTEIELFRMNLLPDKERIIM